MSMALHSRIARAEFDEADRFDFLQTVKDKVIRMDEVHPTTENDSHHIFLVWCSEDDTHKVMSGIKRAVKGSDVDRDWSFKVTSPADGLVIVSTWI